MPAMPIAASRAPMVVGIRQTSSATRVGTSVPRLLQRLREPQIAHHVLLGVPGHRPQRHHDDQKDQRQGGKHQGQRDLVGRALADGAFDQGDHAVEERFARDRGDPHDDPVGDDRRAAGDAGAVAAGLADDRRRFAGDGRFVDRGDAFDDLSVAGNHLPRLHHHRSPGLRSVERHFLDRAVGAQAIGRRVACASCAAIGLGLAARLGQRGREVGEQHGQEQPDVQRDEVGDRNLARRAAERRLDDEEQRQDGADLDHEHDRIVPLDVRPQHDEGLLQRRPARSPAQNRSLAPRRASWPGAERSRRRS